MTAVAAVQAESADRGTSTTAWRRLGKALEHNLSLVCRYLWGADQHGCRALSIETVAEQGRVVHYTLLEAARLELQSYALRKGLDLDDTMLDELLGQVLRLAGRLHDTEREQGREAGLVGEYLGKARGHAAEATHEAEAQLRHLPELRWVGDGREAA